MSLIAGSSVYNPKFSVQAGIDALKKAVGSTLRNIHTRQVFRFIEWVYTGLYRHRDSRAEISLSDVRIWVLWLKQSY